jgi:hypothetical protein
MPRPHPLSDLVQSVHLAHPSPQGLSRFILSTFPSPTIGEPVLVLYGSNEKGELHAWSSKPGRHKVSRPWQQRRAASTCESDDSSMGNGKMQQGRFRLG